MRREDLKKSHIETASGHLRKHINPLLGDMLVSEVVEADTERLVTRLTNVGLAPKTIHNYIGTFHSVMGLAVRGRHIERNPAAMAELPKVRKSKTLRFLNHDELDRVVSTPLPESDQELVAAFPPSRKKDRTSEFGGPQAVRDWWPVLRMLILMAAMTGMRLGELRALRWSDIDYRAMKIRVRREYVRGQYDTPKSLGSERGIPLAARLVTELDEHHQRTMWNQDNDLVLAHPHTGRPLDHARVGLHYHAALVRADVRKIRVARSPAHVRYDDGGLRQSQPPHPPGMDGPRGHPHDPDLRRLHARRARVRTDRRRLRSADQSRTNFCNRTPPRPPGTPVNTRYPLVATMVYRLRIPVAVLKKEPETRAYRRGRPVSSTPRGATPPSAR
jgi:integrase